MRNTLRGWVLTVGLLTSILPGLAVAGYDEGFAAYEKNDFTAAIREFKAAALAGDSKGQFTLGWMYENGQGVAQDYKEAVRLYRLAADQGNANAQFNLGVMVANGQGVAQDYKEAVRLFRLAADQGNANAQNNLGVMHKNGQGVPASNVIAYALYNLSAAGDPSSDNKATANRTALTGELTNQAIEAAQNLTREMGKPKNLVKALDQYLKKPAIKEAPKAALKPSSQFARTAEEDDEEASDRIASSDPFPARPTKTPGVTSCNTRCVNAACWRTYDSGKKVQFQAKHVYDPLSSQWKFDSGNC